MFIVVEDPERMHPVAKQVGLTGGARGVDAKAGQTWESQSTAPPQRCRLRPGVRSTEEEGVHVTVTAGFTGMQALANSESDSNLVYAFEERFAPVGYQLIMYPYHVSYHIQIQNSKCAAEPY